MDDMEGSGTEQDPYKIETFRQLENVRQRLGAYHKLISDIDATDETFEPIGGNTKPFHGTFDGNNHEIRNLCVKQPGKDNVGLFGYIVEPGHIKNIGLTNATISGRISVGSVVGRNYGKIEYSYVQRGDVSGKKYVGSVVGRNYGKIEYSYVQGGDVSGLRSVVGGLIGCNSGEVDLCYIFKVDVSGDKYIGGPIGLNFGCCPLESCFDLSRADKQSISGKTDLIMSRGSHRIFYIVEASTLFAKVNGELYSRENVSPIEMQPLVNEREVAKMTDEFKSAMVATM